MLRSSGVRAYLLKNGAYLRYDEYLKAGLPIATGVIEGACRHLVKDRMELTGARRRLSGAEAVLRLRSLRSSGDFDEYWESHLQQEHERHHRKLYAGGAVPELESAAKSDARIRRLRLVNDSKASSSKSRTQKIFRLRFVVEMKGMDP